MAIDVLIKQKLFGNKTVPLEVILGDSLHYGNFENDRLNIGELGETEFLAYNPRRIGRGFSVIWHPAALHHRGDKGFLRCYRENCHILGSKNR